MTVNKLHKYLYHMKKPQAYLNESMRWYGFLLHDLYNHVW